MSPPRKPKIPDAVIGSEEWVGLYLLAVSVDVRVKESSKRKTEGGKP